MISKSLNYQIIFSKYKLNIALEGVIRRAKLEVSGSIFNKSTQLLGFADDLDIVARTLRALKDAFTRLCREASKIGLHVSEEKTKFMMVSPSNRTRGLVGTHLEIDNMKFEVVDHFTYLGVLVTNTNDNSLEIKRRITSAQRSFYALKNQFTSRSISQNTKLKMYKTLIRPVLLYGCESWSTTMRDEERLSVFERKILRTIYGPVKEGERYRIRYNHELYRLFKEPDVVKTMKLTRISWAGHVIRRNEDDPILKVFKGDFNDGGRLRGRPKNTWAEAINKDCTTFGLSNWQRLAKDRIAFKNFLDSAKVQHEPSSHR